MLDYLKLIGRGPGLVAFPFFTVAIMALMQRGGHDIAAWTGPLGVLAGGLYAGGALKAFADRRNGK